MEAISIVCDYGDGRLAAEQVTISYSGKRLVVDLCAQHLRELTKNARAPRRGRKPKSITSSTAKRRGRPPGSKNNAVNRKPGKKTGTRRVAKRAGTRRSSQ